MVKLDAHVLRYMSKDEFRVLTAVEMGMKNHEVVPTSLITRIAKLKKGGAVKTIKLLHKNKLIFHDAKKYDGYRLTYLGYDYLALKAMVSRGHLAGIGSRIGVGKESDIYECVDPNGRVLVLKLHRLGRTSFRSIKINRDYLLNRSAASWLYMARLAATREFAYMKALKQHDFPVPDAVDHNRHAVLMEKVQASPFIHVKKLCEPGQVYSVLMNLIVRLAEHGLIHCDFNEFNLMLDDKTSTVTLIDFPQMVSTTHENAKYYFDRDVQCVRTYFEKRFNFKSEEYPQFFAEAEIHLDQELAASGASKFSKEERAQFQKYMTMLNDGARVNQEHKEESEEEDEEEEGVEQDSLEGKRTGSVSETKEAGAGGAGGEARPSRLQALAAEAAEGDADDGKQGEYAAVAFARVCGGCGKRDGQPLTRCSRCKRESALYCSRVCQRKAWRAHKPLCHPPEESERSKTSSRQSRAQSDSAGTGQEVPGAGQAAAASGDGSSGLPQSGPDATDIAHQEEADEEEADEEDAEGLQEGEEELGAAPEGSTAAGNGQGTKARKPKDIRARVKKARNKKVGQVMRKTHSKLSRNTVKDRVRRNVKEVIRETRDLRL